MEKTDSEPETLPVVPTATPSPTSTPAPTAKPGEAQPVSPETTEEIFVYPQAGDSEEESSDDSRQTHLETLPEDAWAAN